MAKKTKKENTEVALVENRNQITNTEVATQQSIQNCILTIRGQQVMLDRDLSVLYGVETKKLNQAVKRNIERFPDSFMFQLSKEEIEDWKLQIATSNLHSFSGSYDEFACSRSQFVTLNNGRGRNVKYSPYAFTEQGVAMLSAVLHSDTAVAMSIRIIEAFVAMRRLLASNTQVFQRIEAIEHNQLLLTDTLTQTNKQIEKHNQQLEEVFRRFDEGKDIPMQGVFYNGEIWDAYILINDLIRKAKKRIVLIDNYIDDTVLERLDKRKVGVAATIYTRSISRQLQLDIAAHNIQQPPIEVLTTDKPHDRFLIIDHEVYLIGASIKDLGKKIFGFTKMEEPADKLLKRLNE